MTIIHKKMINNNNLNFYYILKPIKHEDHLDNLLQTRSLI